MFTEAKRPKIVAERWRIDYTKTRNCACCKKKEKPPRRLDLTVPSHGSHAWVAMQVQTKFLRLFREVAVGDRIDGCNKSPTGCVNARAIM
jgi:hypothetical protein